tara:strand:- start:737 stop:1507 length:771 start_codon:yes stop_codon:yes gene_type:complete
MATYSVNTGDSFWKIARGFGVDPIDLLRANGLTMADVQAGNANLFRGDVLTLPEGFTASEGWLADGTTGTDTTDTEDSDITSPEDDYLGEDFEWIAPTDPIQDYVGDAAYDAFLAQYHLDVGQAQQTRIQQGTLLQAGIQNQLGTLIDEGGDPYDISGERTGGVLGLQEKQAQRKRETAFGGKGMAFGGGNLKAESRIGAEYDAAEASYWHDVNQQRNIIGQNYMTTRNQLEREKLAQEAAAYQRRIAEETTAVYG